MNDPAFLQSVLEGLPGVDAESEDIKNALTKKDDKNKEEKKWRDRYFVYMIIFFITCMFTSYIFNISYCIYACVMYIWSRENWQDEFKFSLVLSLSINICHL